MLASIRLLPEWGAWFLIKSVPTSDACRKDRSLRQLLQGNAFSNAGAAAGCDLLSFSEAEQSFTSSLSDFP
jgi:hypothetical protein